MESLSDALQPYREIIGQVASIVTIAQFFSGAFVCRDIYNKKSTKGTPAIPFVGGVVVGILMLKLAFLLDDPAMFQVNVAAIFLNSIYSVFYYFFSENQMEEILKPAAIGFGIVSIFLGYAAWEDPMNLEFRYGLIVTVLMLLLLASPLMDLKEIIEKKDASSIPFPLTFMGALVSFLWLVYGIVIMNIFMVIQNFIGLFLCLGQLALIYQYPGQGQGQNKKKKKTSKKD